MLGEGAGWNPPFPDQAQTLSAHLAFQSDVWRWPLLHIGTLFWPHGVSGALVDFNPLLSLVAKLWTKATGGHAVNLFGAWIALCWLLQPLAAIYAVRGLRAFGLAEAGAAGVLSVCWPALLARQGHLNLCAHFLLLTALGLTFRRLDRRGGWVAPGLTLLAAILVHPYLFQLCAALFAAIPLHSALSRRSRWGRDVAGYLTSNAMAAAIFIALSFVSGGKDSGFVFFSMNGLSPIWPQRSGIFGADLPVIDATGGQYEGFNWLGAGVMALVVVWIGGAVAMRRVAVPDYRRPATALAIVLIGLTLLSLSSRVYVGRALVLDLGAQPWESLFGTFRAPGRAFWPVGYTIMLFAVASAGRLPRPAGLILLLAASGLQIVDSQPLRAEARAAWTMGSRVTTPPLPAGTTLFTAAPFSGCTRDMAIKVEEPIMILAAVRAGARTGEIGLGRPPHWFNCKRVESDALELPLVPGETRALLGADEQRAIRGELLGPDVTCAVDGSTTLCGRGVAMPANAAPPGGEALARLSSGERLAGAALARLFGVGWLMTPSGEAWSEGARATLVLVVAPGPNRTLTIEVEGVARPSGGQRVLHVLLGRAALDTVALSDGARATISVPVPAATASRSMRIAIDIDGDIDPRKYGFAAPVQRAGVILHAVTLSAG